MIRECSHVSSTNCGEVSRTDYIFLGSINNCQVNNIAKRTREGQDLHTNGNVEYGKQDERELVNIGAKRKYLEKDIYILYESSS